jgi:hypothetical protein
VILTAAIYAGSESPKSLELPLDKMENPMEIHPRLAGNSNNLNVTSPPLLGDGGGDLNSPVDVSAEKYFGLVTATSLQYPDDTLDWSIIRITEEHQSLANTVCLPTRYGEGPVHIVDIADPEQTSGGIWAITASNGPVKGHLSTVPYYLKMAGCTTFQKTWTACLGSNVGR